MHLHLDCQFGMAGDMLLAALIDAGADQQAILSVLRDIPLKDFELKTERVLRGGISATLVDVLERDGQTRKRPAAHAASANRTGGDEPFHPDPHHPSHEDTESRPGPAARPDAPRPIPNREDAPFHPDPHHPSHEEDEKRRGGGCCRDRAEGGMHPDPHHPSHEEDEKRRGGGCCRDRAEGGMHPDPHHPSHEEAHGHGACGCGGHGHSHGDEQGFHPDPHHPSHEREHGGESGHGGGPHRHLSDLLALLDAEAVPQRVRERAERVFRTMAEAEAAVHGVSVESVHFHEISGIDTAVDVIGSCVALELLEVDSISASAPSVGSGMVMCDHGIFPVPAPATLEILKRRNIPWRAGGEGERATPTGMALLAGLAESFGDSPEISVHRIGYGAGHRDFADVPNLLRAIIGKPGRSGESERLSGKTIIAEREPEMSSELVRVPVDEAMLPETIAAMLPGDITADGDRVVEFRFVVDDMTPEAVAYLCERSLASGALEAYAVAATMKKGRSGHEVTVLASPESAPAVARVLWRESTTFGMRVGERSRLVLARESRPVLVLGHEVRVKLGWLGGALVRRQPEYEDCRKAALAAGRPLAEVYDLAVRAADKFAQK